MAQQQLSTDTMPHMNTVKNLIVRVSSSAPKGTLKMSLVVFNALNELVPNYKDLFYDCMPTMFTDELDGSCEFHITLSTKGSFFHHFFIAEIVSNSSHHEDDDASSAPTSIDLNVTVSESITVVPSNGDSSQFRKHTIAAYTHTIDTAQLQLEQNRVCIGRLVQFMYPVVKQNQTRFERKFLFGKELIHSVSQPFTLISELPPVPTLFIVNVKEAQGLTSMDLNGYSDPYVTVQAFGQTLQTAVIKKNLNPEWNEKLKFSLVPRSSNASLYTNLANNTLAQIHVQVWDWDMLKSPDFEGQLEKVPIQTLCIDKMSSETLVRASINQKVSGTLTLSYSYAYNDDAKVDKATAQSCEDALKWWHMHDETMVALSFIPQYLIVSVCSTERIHKMNQCMAKNYKQAKVKFEAKSPLSIQHQQFEEIQQQKEAAKQSKLLETHKCLIRNNEEALWSDQHDAVFIVPYPQTIAEAKALQFELTLIGNALPLGSNTATPAAECCEEGVIATGIFEFSQFFEQAPVAAAYGGALLQHAVTMSEESIQQENINTCVVNIMVEYK